MDYKEEYQKALERAKKGLPIDEVFPELKASEDERIIDDAIQIIRASRQRCAEYGAEADKHLKAISYLEKQKEQKHAEKITDAKIEQAMDEVTKFKVFAADLAKAFGITHRRDIDWHNFCAGLLTYLELNRPAKWSEEDEAAFGDLMWCIEQARKSAKDENDMGNIWFAEKWVKGRIKSFSPQPKQEWSEEDEKIFNSLCTILHGGLSSIPTEQYIYWLKSLRPHWKPSEEQTEVDLEKELQAFLCNYDYEFEDDAPACDIARHFYELGLNAKKEK